MRTAGHIVYRTDDGEIVPSVTTITGLRSKPGLIKWANAMGLAGTDSSKYATDTAEIGTLAHSIITDRLQGLETDYSDYTPNQTVAAEDCVAGYCAWEVQHEVKPVIVEKPLVSEKYHFGGTLDLYGDIDHRRTLLDIKTGRIWPDHTTQAAAYRQLLSENGHDADGVCILSLRDGFTELYIDNKTLDRHFEIFLALLKIYQIEKELSK